MNRPGVSLAEQAVALALGGIVCAALVGVLHGTQRLARSHTARVASAEALRVPGVVLAGELRLLDPVTDLIALGPDSLRLRALRGVAIVCGGGAGATLVRYRGLRDPDPAKDSILTLGRDGAEAAVPLEGSAESAGSCAGLAGEEVFGWKISGAPPDGAVLLLFESGSYHLSGRAFRYLRGAAGRQPLTEEWLAEGRNRFEALDLEGAVTTDPAAMAAVEVRLVVEPGGVRAEPDRSRRAARVRIPLLNRRAPAAGPVEAGGVR